jgi:hypothetical protein
MDSTSSMRGNGSAKIDLELQDLLVPDLITPEQHQDRTRPEVTDRPEVRIMLAVLEDAVAIYKRGFLQSNTQNRRVFREVLEWIDSTADGPLFSFERICATVGFEPAAIREGLRRWAQRLQAYPNAAAPRAIYRRRSDRRITIGGRDARRSAPWQHSSGGGRDGHRVRTVAAGTAAVSGPRTTRRGPPLG